MLFYCNSVSLVLIRLCSTTLHFLLSLSYSESILILLEY